MSDEKRKLKDCTEIRVDMSLTAAEEREKLAKGLADQPSVLLAPDKNPVERLRPCKGTYWYKREAHEVVGRFHGWGSDYEEFCDAGPGNFTVGIIEANDGTVYMVRADTIVFLDRDSGDEGGEPDESAR